MHTCDTKHAKRHPCGVRSATAVIPVAPLEGRLSIAHRRQVQRASGALVRSSSHGRGPACSACVLLAMPSRALGVRCGARLGRAGPRLTALRPESNLHPDVPTGPTPPCSPPLITALGQVRGSIWAIVGAAGGGVGGDGTLRGAPPWAFGSRGSAAAQSVARRALGRSLRPAWSLYNAVGCREVVPVW